MATTSSHEEQDRASADTPPTRTESNNTSSSVASADHSHAYDDVAGEYDQIKDLPGTAPLVRLIDRFAPAVLDWSDVSVLDLACGTGFGIRKARQLGASRVVGIDINEEMLRVARSSTQPATELYVGDCYRDLGPLDLEPESFDVVSGYWLADAATTVDDVEGMWNNVAKYLKPGGRFIGSAGFVNHTTTAFAAKYGFKIDPVETTAVGTKISVEFQVTPRVQFETHRVRREILDATAAAAGLNITYVKPSILDVEITAKHDLEWWQEFLEDPASDLVVGTKRKSGRSV